MSTATASENSSQKQPLSHTLAHSLIREYLATHAQRHILALFDKENPVTPGISITKRSEIYQILQLSASKTLDAEENALKESILEKLILERLKRIKRKKRREEKEGQSTGDATEKKKKHKKKSSSRLKESGQTHGEVSSAAPTGVSNEAPRRKSSSRRAEKSHDEAPLGRQPSYTSTTSSPPKRSAPQRSVYDFDDTPQSASSETPTFAPRRTGFTADPKPSSSRSNFANNDSSWGMKKSHRSTAHDDEELMLEDVDDAGFLDIDDSHQPTPHRTARPSTLKPKQIGSTTGQHIRHLIMGETKMFDRSWLEQGFAFATRSDTLYGIVQNEGGSCGVIAAVQAHVIKELLMTKHSLERLTDRDYRGALIDALTSILFNIDHSRMVVCIGKRSTDHANPDLCFGNFTYYECTSRDETRDCISRNIASFSNGRGLGVLQLMASAILTRGIENVKKDMDMAGNSMIVEYGYCSQELVNLLLVGRATSNVFDGMKMIGSRGDKTYLKGIQSKSEIGFLTLMESYKYLEVGSNYKEAKNSVWVIFSESHYSILFAKDNKKDVKKFTLYYWDGLANQEEEIALTITRTGVDQTAELTADSFVPPLNRCIWTLWPDATIDWSCDPLY